MSAAKTLLTGPYGSDVRGVLLRNEVSDRSSLWLVPTPLARMQVLEGLARAAKGRKIPHVWCWEELWQAVRESRDDGPAQLSDAGARAVLGLAFDRARESGRLNATAAVAGLPGFRRRVRERIVGWTRRDLFPDREPPETGPTIEDEWAIYGHYRAALKALDVEDAEGFANWAARSLGKFTPPSLKTLGTVTVLDPDGETPAVRRALEFFEAKARKVRVVLGYDPEPMLADVFSAVAPLRAELIARGYAESSHASDLWRPPALRDVEKELFRDDAHGRPTIKNASGLNFLGAPQGEGVGLVVAREVKRRLDEGAGPEEVLILVRHWDEDAEAVLGVLRSWGLPVSALGRPRRLASEPAVSALRMALRLENEGWEAAELVRLLRHGQFRPDWPSARTPDALARAAGAVRDRGVYRGDRQIVRALGDGPSADLVKRLIDEIKSSGRPGSWFEHVARLRRLSETLGIGRDGDEALERFGNAIDDYAAVLDAAAPGRVVPFRAFVDAVESVVADDCEVETALRPGTFPLATLDQALGARARFVILANLAEGAFPTRASVEPAADPANPTRVGRAFAREMARFLRVIGSADECLTLAYPTRDEKGQEILPAGFLDDLTRRIEPRVLTELLRNRVQNRFDPALLEHPDLAVAPADARARAVALACVRHEPRELARLASERSHRRTLAGTAAALSLTAHRLDPRGFTPYDGRLIDMRVYESLAAQFGPQAIFSPSQLESYLLCPFQFFLKYVLKLTPVNDGDELDEDFIGRGNRVHEALETMERLKAQAGGFLSIEDFVTQTTMSAALSDGSEANPALSEIEDRRFAQTLRRYDTQARDYAHRPKEPPARPAHFEIVFGDTREDNALPCVEIGEGPDAVRLQGRIDRVDILDSGQGPSFRVIDYKTGAPPSPKDVMGFLMVQLPLYALAVERLGLAGETAEPSDVGYWDLREKGFKKIDLKDWTEMKARLEAEVVGAVARLRQGRFVVDPKKDDCTRFCDYATVCRIGQVRPVGKGAGQHTL